MADRKRQGNNPKRRLVREGEAPAKIEALISRARYVGSAHHKSKHSDYGFIPPTNPRPDKSLCDGIRKINKKEATELFQNGISREMVSRHSIDGLPKYIWAVDAHEEVYEAILSKGTAEYHGYRLEPDDSMYPLVIKEWKLRNRT